jgi:hypothetical protein
VVLCHRTPQTVRFRDHEVQLEPLPRVLRFEVARPRVVEVARLLRPEELVHQVRVVYQYDKIKGKMLDWVVQASASGFNASGSVGLDVDVLWLILSQDLFTTE